MKIYGPCCRGLTNNKKNKKKYAISVYVRPKFYIIIILYRFKNIANQSSPDIVILHSIFLPHTRSLSLPAAICSPYAGWSVLRKSLVAETTNDFVSFSFTYNFKWLRNNSFGKTLYFYRYRFLKFSLFFLVDNIHFWFHIRNTLIYTMVLVSYVKRILLGINVHEIIINLLYPIAVAELLSCKM